MVESGPAAIAPGSVIAGDFRVVAPLSAGGMGAVWVAEQLSTGKRRALKIMHPALVQDPMLRDKFVQEARVGSMVSSSHVVEVVAAGIEPASGAPWIAMELLEGENLAAHVARRGALGPAEVAAIATEMCHALGAAHAAGVVHRDIKPENVFLAQTQSAAQPISVKVLDFGIAKVAAQASATATSVMGTPLWMAPEQSDATGRISPATDVWALGLLVFWLLTGRQYWRAPNLGTASVHVLMREILFEPLAPASARAAEYGVAERLPPGFDGWFVRTVVREPEARHADANAALAALLPVLAGAAAPTSSAYAASSPVASSSPHSASPSLPPPMRAAEPRKSSIGIWFGIGGVLVAFAAVAVAAVAIYVLSQRGPERAAPAPALSPTPSAAPAPLPSSESAEVKPVSSSAHPAGPKPSATTSATATAKKPFNASQAQQVVNSRAASAKFMCANMGGPSLVSGSVNFRPDGHCSVFVDVSVSVTPRGNCVRGQVASSLVPPFDGAATPVPFAVGF